VSEGGTEEAGVREKERDGRDKDRRWEKGGEEEERANRERERERERGRRCLGEFTLTLQANINLGQDLASLM
jgi:hypothetical protein